MVYVIHFVRLCHVFFDLTGNGLHVASIVENVFCGIEQSVVKCCGCQQEFKTSNPMMVVQLELRTNISHTNRCALIMICTCHKISLCHNICRFHKIRCVMTSSRCYDTVDLFSHRSLGTGGMDSVTQALKSYCEAEYMEDTNMYKCGSETCKGEEQNAHKSLHFQVGSYYSKIGEKRYIFLVNLVNCCELPSLRTLMNRKRCSPTYVCSVRVQRTYCCTVRVQRSAALLHCAVPL